MSPEIERDVRSAWESGRMEDAVTLALRGYGSQIYRFLVARMRSADHADEVFGQLAEDLWRGIEGFRWESAILTWMYTLARNAAARYERSPHNQARRHTTASRLQNEALKIRTATRPYLRTEAKDQLEALREELSPDERTLLLLRVSRGMAWNDVARVMHDGPLEGEDDLKRASANARQRFATLKRKLADLARERGIVPTEP